MTFTAPTILIALLALAIPVAVHLLGRRRAQVVILPTARFAEGAHQERRGRLWLKRVAVLATRLSVIALLVLALAGPRLTGRAEAGAKPPAAPKAESPRPDTPRAPLAHHTAPAPPLRVLIVDAADETGARVRSADLVAAAFAGPQTAVAKQVARTAAGKVTPTTLAGADVVFWVGSRAATDAAALEDYAARGRVVWVPADRRPPDAALATALGIAATVIEETKDGAMIDPAGYLSDLVEAFEGGTSGDLAAPIFRHRLVLDAAGGEAIRFRNGPPAIVDRPSETGRVVLLAAGPGPAWGDLATRAEFVVLMHSLAEALAPDNARTEPRLDKPAVPQVTVTSDQSSSPASKDLTPWCVLALAAAVAGESLLVAWLGRERGICIPESHGAPLR